MSKMTESDIELMAIEQLEGLGYRYVYGPDIESTGVSPLRSYKQVILESKVLEALQRLNPQLSEDKCLEALKQVSNIHSPDVLSNNQAFHRLLTEGINIEVSKNGNTQGELAWLLDFNDPNNNEWKMLAVGFPIWLWTEGPTTMSTSASASGFTFQMTARWKSTTFHMGDGNTVTCSSMEKYPSSVKPGTPSPNCGYAYSKPSLPKGKYQVRAVADWEVTWSVAGFSGVLPAYNEASASIPIGELVALNR